METKDLHEAFVDRLCSAVERELGVYRHEHGFRRALAKALGARDSTVQRWFADSYPEANYLLRIHQKFGITPDALLGIDSAPSKHYIDVMNLRSVVGIRGAPQLQQLVDSADFTLGPILNNSRSVCHPSNINSKDIDSWALTRNDFVLHRKNIIGLIVPQSIGMSMYPIIKPGDLIVLDANDKEIIDGGIYAIKVDDSGCIIRQVKQNGDSLVLIPWFLHGYPVEAISLKENPDPIIGKIIFSITYFNFMQFQDSQPFTIASTQTVSM
jgi:hypothetical protein